MQIKSSTQNNYSMKGALYIKGHAPSELKKSLKNSNYFKKLILENDVIARVSYQIADFRYRKNDFIYQIKYSILKENSFKERFLDFFNLKKRFFFNKQFLSLHEIIESLSK